MLWSLLILLGCPDTSSTPTPTDLPDGEPLTAVIAPAPTQPMVARFRQGPDGVYTTTEDGLARTLDGETWEVVADEGLTDPSWTADGTRYGLVYDDAIGESGGYRVARDDAAGRTTLPAPWDTLDVTSVDLVGSGDTLWVEVGSRLSDVALDSARFWRWDPVQSTFVEQARPGDAPLWHFEPDGAGGVWVYDVSSNEGPYALKRFDGAGWVEVYSHPTTTLSDVLRTDDGSWLIARIDGVDAGELLRSDDEGATFVPVLPQRAQVDQAPGGRLVARDFLDSTVHWVSSDDGLTWSEQAGQGYPHLLVDWAALDDRLIASDLGYLVHRLDGEALWAGRGLPFGENHRYFGIDSFGDRLAVTLVPRFFARSFALQAAFVSSDAGAHWTRAIQNLAASGSTICGGNNGWFIGGTTGASDPAGGGAIGAGFAIISADGGTLVAQGVTNTVPGKFVNQEPVNLAALNGEITDCVWADNPASPVGGEVTYTVTGAPGAGGVVVENGAWLDLGFDPDAATPTAVRGAVTNPDVALIDDVIGSQSGLDFLFTNSALVQWPNQPGRVVDGSRDLWTFDNNEVGFACYLGNDVYQCLPVTLEGYPEATGEGETRLNAAVTAGDGRLWLATDGGVYVSEAPLLEL